MYQPLSDSMKVSLWVTGISNEAFLRTGVQIADLVKFSLGRVVANDMKKPVRLPLEDISKDDLIAIDATIGNLEGVDGTDDIVQAGLAEGLIQRDAILRGIAKVVPLNVVKMFRWRELERLVVGEQHVDIELLRRHTEYGGGIGQDEDYIEWFWQMLDDFGQDERRKFLTFAWGQETLPSDDEEFIRSRTRMMLKPSPFPDPDQALPRADTCFFNVELPRYTSKQVMQTRFRQAFSYGMNIDADQTDVEGWMG